MLKKMLLSLTTLAVVASPLAASEASAQPGPRREVHQTEMRGPHGREVINRTVVTRPAPGPRRWAKGQRFDRRYATNYREVDYRTYHLRPAPRGYHWVRSGNDAVLVALSTGIIASVLAGAIR